MTFLLRLVGLVALLVAIVGAAFFVGYRILRPASTYAVIEETTLVVLGGHVEVQRAGGGVAPATGDTTLRVGDRVRTGPDGYASITHFDGSTTALDPNTDLVLRRLDMAPGGVGSIAFQMESGATWNRMERLVDSSTRFEVSTVAGTVVARGTAFRVRVDANGRTAVESMLDSVEVEAAGSVVALDAGLRTTIDVAQPPAEPVPAQMPRFALRLDFDGPVRPFLTDERHRSIGFHPDVDVFVSQIPSATYTVEGERRRLYLPDPVESYQLVLKGQGSGGAYNVTAIPVVDGRPVAGAGDGLASPLPAQSSGSVGSGQIKGMALQVRRPDVLFRGSLEGQVGAPSGSRVAVVQRQLRASARAVETAAVLAAPTATASPTATPTDTPTTPTVTLTATASVTRDPRTPATAVPTAAPASATRVVTTAPAATAPAATVPALAATLVPRTLEPTVLPSTPEPSIPAATALPPTTLPVTAPLATARPTEAAAATAVAATPEPTAAAQPTAIATAPVASPTAQALSSPESTVRPAVTFAVPIEVGASATPVPQPTAPAATVVPTERPPTAVPTTPPAPPATSTAVRAAPPPPTRVPTQDGASAPTGP